MCIILASLNGQELTKNQLELSFKGNAHGVGFMYSKEKKLYIKKGYFEFEEFYKDYHECIGNPHVIHFRYKTSGKQDKVNCHPFVIRHQETISLESKEEVKKSYEPLLAFAHNGVITGFSKTDTSDTFNFNIEILQGFDSDSPDPNWWKIPELKELLEKAIGKNNKLVLLDNEGHIEIFNFSCGEWVKENEIWASNDSYKTLKVRATIANHYDDDYVDHYLYQARQKREKELPPQGSNDQSNKISITTVKPTDHSSPQNSYERFKKISSEELEEIDRFLENANKS